jgi:hypothetical protein
MRTREVMARLPGQQRRQLRTACSTPIIGRDTGIDLVRTVGRQIVQERHHGRVPTIAGKSAYQACTGLSRAATASHVQHHGAARDVSEDDEGARHFLTL